MTRASECKGSSGARHVAAQPVPRLRLQAEDMIVLRKGCVTYVCFETALTSSRNPGSQIERGAEGAVGAECAERVERVDDAEDAEGAEGAVNWEALGSWRLLEEA